MKKLLLFVILFLFNISYVSASTNTANSYVLMDMTTNRVLSSKDKDSPRLIASITKIMTCILAIESNRLDELVKVDESILKAYGSGIYIEVGEEMYLRDMLYGLMLRSGNDAAVMIATYTSGSEEEFVKKMNTKAKEIGMKNTVFINASGLDNEKGNYSTSYDMAILTSYAMKNSIYREIVSTKKKKVTTNNKTYIWNNKNKLLDYDFVTGGKTGYTKKAGRTLVSTASKDNMDLVVVTIRDSDDWKTHLELYDYAFDNYTGYRVLNKNKFKVIGDTYYKDNLYIKNDVYIPLKNDETRSLISYVKLEKKSNYLNGDMVGRKEIYLGKELLYKENIYVDKNKIKHTNNFFNWIRGILK